MAAVLFGIQYKKYALFAVLLLSIIGMGIGWNVLSNYNGYCSYCDNLTPKQNPNVQQYCNMLGVDPEFNAYPVLHQKFFVPLIAFSLLLTFIVVYSLMIFIGWIYNKDVNFLIQSSKFFAFIALICPIVLNSVQNVNGKDYALNASYQCQQPNNANFYANTGLVYYIGQCYFWFSYTLFYQSCLPISILLFIFVFALGFFEGKSQKQEKDIEEEEAAEINNLQNQSQ